MQHLLALGHHDIAFISGPLTLGSAVLRAEVFRRTWSAHEPGKTLKASWLQEGDHRVEGGHRAMQRILASGEGRPTAVVTSNDLTAIGAMGAIHEASLRIPQDISVVGFDGIELSAYTLPALTTLAVSRVDLASMAFRSLWRHRDDAGRPHAEEEHVIEPRLLVRQSTAAAKAR